MNHRDYDTLMNHGGSPPPNYNPPSHAMVPAGHGPPPGYPTAPTHDMRGMHETIGHLQRELAELRHGGGHQHHPQHAPQHHGNHGQGHGGNHRGQGNPTHVRSTAREFPVGFIAKQVQPGASAELEVKPQVTFQGHRLAVDPRLARYFNIVDIKIGKDSQLAATGEMPAAAFSALAVGVAMELDHAEPGIVITLIVRNDDAAPQDFKAVLYGSVIEKEKAA